MTSPMTSPLAPPPPKDVGFQPADGIAGHPIATCGGLSASPLTDRTRAMPLPVMTEPVTIQPGAAPPAAIKKVLVADEDLRFEERLIRVLSDEYKVVTARNGEEVLAKVSSERPQLAVLSATLPSSLQQETYSALCVDTEYPLSPLILMMGNSDNADDRADALDAGVADYLVKPFGLREFMARVHALLRARSQFPEFSHHKLSSSGVHLDVTAREVFIESKSSRQEVALSLKEFELLHFLMERRGVPVSRETLLKRIWGHTPTTDSGHTGESAGCITDSNYQQKSKTLSAHICLLRSKLECDPSCPPRIRTLANFGYCFGAEDMA